LRESESTAALDDPQLRDELLPGLVKECRTLAEEQIPPIIQRARAEMRTQLDHELARLRELRKVNRNVTEAEISLLEDYRRDLDQHLTGARLRLDALRMILPAQFGHSRKS
jgi:ATP-dependent helicase HepA